MWWILIPTLAVLVSAGLALAYRGRNTPMRFDRSVDEPKDDRPTA